MKNILWIICRQKKKWRKQMNRLEKMMHKERYMRNGAVQLNLLRYDIMWVVSRWGFMGKENVTEFFDFVSELFHEDKDVKEATKSKKVKSKKTKEVASLETPEVKAEMDKVAEEVAAAELTQPEEVKENTDDQSVSD